MSYPTEPREFITYYNTDTVIIAQENILAECHEHITATLKSGGRLLRYTNTAYAAVAFMPEQDAAQ